MKLRILMGVSVITILAALALPTQCMAQKNNNKLPYYTVRDLGTLGGTDSLAGGISNSGWVEGWSALPDGTERAVVWHNGMITNLGTLGGPNSSAGWTPSNSGEVGGVSDNTTPDPNGEDFCGFGTGLECVPFFWRNDVMTPLPLLGGNNGYAAGVNNRGQVAGQAENNTPDAGCASIGGYYQVLPVVWENGEVQSLRMISGDSDAAAWGINDWGQAVGGSGTCPTSYHAVLWQFGKATDLGNLGGTTNNVGYAINNWGQIVGFSGRADNTTHAFLWQWGVMTDLGTLPGDVYSEGDGINDWGQVAGGSEDASGNSRAFIWQNGVMTDLNTLIPPNSPLYLLWASGGINDQGQIVGYALVISTGDIHAFLLTPSYGQGAGESAATAARQRPNVTLPENVRKRLQRRARFGRPKGEWVTPR